MKRQQTKKIFIKQFYLIKDLYLEYVFKTLTKSVIKQTTPLKTQAEDLNRCFTKDMQMKDKHMKRCSSLIIGEVQIRASVGQQYTQKWLKLKTDHSNAGQGLKTAITHC